MLEVHLLALVHEQDILNLPSIEVDLPTQAVLVSGVTLEENDR